MQGWQNLLSEISVGLMVNAIIDILYWLIKREFRFFKRKMHVPRPLETPLKRENKSLFQRPLNFALPLTTASNTTYFTPQKKSSEIEFYPASLTFLSDVVLMEF